jgi:hypothetical protein
MLTHRAILFMSDETIEFNAWKQISLMDFLMPQSKPTITAELIEWAVKTSNKHFGPLVTTCLTLSAAMGLVGVASCGIPFVPPAGKVAIVLGALGIIASIAGMLLVWPRGGRIRVLFILFGVLLLTLNGITIWAGQLGKHLIDYIESH